MSINLSDVINIMNEKEVKYKARQKDEEISLAFGMNLVDRKQVIDIKEVEDGVCVSGFTKEKNIKDEALFIELLEDIETFKKHQAELDSLSQSLDEKEYGESDVESSSSEEPVNN